MSAWAQIGVDFGWPAGGKSLPTLTSTRHFTWLVSARGFGPLQSTGSVAATGSCSGAYFNRFVSEKTNGVRILSVLRRQGSRKDLSERDRGRSSVGADGWAADMEGCVALAAGSVRDIWVVSWAEWVAASSLK